MTVDPVNLYRDQQRRTGSRSGSARVHDDFHRLVGLYLAGELKMDELGPNEYPLENINDAHRALAGGENMRGMPMF